MKFKSQTRIYVYSWIKGHFLMLENIILIKFELFNEFIINLYIKINFNLKSKIKKFMKEIFF
jgi:hypothetical protein